MSEDVYQPSGRVAWLRLILFSLVALPVIMLLSDLAFRLDKAHYYPPFLGAVAVGTLAAVLASGVVGWGKCRNVWVGRTIGVLLAMLFFFGFFQRSLIDARMRGSPEGLNGVPISELVAGLPNYIALRMRNFEVAPDAARPLETHHLLSYLRWIIFGMELAALIGLGWWLGGTAAKRPFSERHGSWTTAKRFALPTGTGEKLLGWLNQESPIPDRSEKGALGDIALLERTPKANDDGYLTLLVGTGRARRFLAKRRWVPSERLEELRMYLEP